MKKKSPFMTFLKIVLVILTIIYPLFMCIMTGAGIISNRESYGAEITRLGVELIVSGISLAAASFLVLPRKKIPNRIAPFLSAASIIVCFSALSKLVKHAEDAGWTGTLRYEGVPVADMYSERIIPVVFPFVITVVISAAGFFSYDYYEQGERKNTKIKKKKTPPHC